MNQHAARTSENGVLLRPASLEEAGLFYSELDVEQDKALGTVGHIRMDFGHNGKEFWHTWWPHNEDQLNTPEFKDELQTIVDTLRTDGPLKDLTAMRSFCAQNGGAITRDGRSFGYVVETDRYRYCLRCTPSPGDYQGYLYCYDKQQQELAQQVKLVGRVTYADGKTSKLTITNRALSGILIHKTDESTGEGIYGVSFLLYDSSNTPIGQYTSDDRGYVYIEDLEAGRYTDGFTQWMKQVIGLCLTAFLQATILVAGLMVFSEHPLLGLGLMLSAGEVPRIAGTFGLDTTTRANIMSAVYTAQAAVNTTRTIVQAVTK